MGPLPARVVSVGRNGGALENIAKLISTDATDAIAADYVASPQRGSLAARSIDEHMLVPGCSFVQCSCTGQGAATLLLDFQAAFPCLDRRAMFEDLRRLRVPGSFFRLIGALCGGRTSLGWRIRSRLA